MFKKLLAKLEYGMLKIMTLCNSMEFVCTKEKIFEFLDFRDFVADEISDLDSSTFEYRRAMWD